MAKEQLESFSFNPQSSCPAAAAAAAAAGGARSGKEVDGELQGYLDRAGLDSTVAATLVKHDITTVATLRGVLEDTSVEELAKELGLVTLGGRAKLKQMVASMAAAPRQEELLSHL